MEVSLEKQVRHQAGKENNCLKCAGNASARVLAEPTIGCSIHDRHRPATDQWKFLVDSRVLNDQNKKGVNCNGNEEK